jgi:hypothetical protein
VLIVWSCRLTSGNDIIAWSFIPAAAIINVDGTPFEISKSKLATYHSSKDVSREFCSNCGSIVFYRHDSRPGLYDVAVGLMSSKSGAHAEDWLEWTKNCPFEQESRFREFTDRLLEECYEYFDDS